MNTIQPYDLVKVNRNNVDTFIRECSEYGISWGMKKSQIAKLTFRVHITTSGRAYITDGKSTKFWWVSKSILLKVKESVEEALRPEYNND